MTETTLQGIEKMVCDDIAARQALGIRKYGQTVQQADLPLEDWLQHAYLETLDKAVYLKAAIESRKALPEMLARELFTNGCGSVADRLVLEGRGGRDLGGLCFGVVVDRIRAWLNDRKRS
ncbi:hypothetical protein GCM10023213_14050 [Prosthecobacter algae]|uniref:Uncharacterized protein n=1 Tax=Prosthecobacter algae TaxID=1144682 RepID=A0ABP9NZ16_9BACT